MLVSFANCQAKPDAPRTAIIALRLGSAMQIGQPDCDVNDWLKAGYTEIIVKRPCNSDIDEVELLAKSRGAEAAIKGPSGDYGLIMSDGRVGYCKSSDSPTIWLYKLRDCRKSIWFGDSGPGCWDRL